jgi:hypothetical protein
MKRLSKLIIGLGLAIFILAGFCGCGGKHYPATVFPTTTDAPPVVYKLVPLATMTSDNSLPNSCYIGAVMGTNGIVYYSFYAKDDSGNIMLMTIQANSTLIVEDGANTADEMESPQFESGQPNNGYWYSWALHLSPRSIVNNYFTAMPVTRDNRIYDYSTSAP